MFVHVLFFSVFRDITGCSELEISLEPPAQVKDLTHKLFQKYPALAQWEKSILTAVNETYVKSDHLLEDGDEVAYMPPVQGG